MLTEKDLIELGFERNDDNDGYEEYYYYTLDIGDDYTPFCLISKANNEEKDKGWFVEIFDYEAFKFKDRFQLEKLIETLKYNLK